MLPFSPRRFRAYRDDLSQAILDLSRERRPEFHELTQDLRNVVQRNMTFDLKKMSKDDLVRELDKGDVQAGTTERVEKWIGDQILEVNWSDGGQNWTASVPLGLLSEVRMTPIDRIKAKALQARAIAPQAIKDFESDLDSIIGEREVLAQKRAESVNPHKEAIAGIYGEFDGLKAAMDLLSNGGPPLEESGPVSPVSTTEPQG